MFDTWRHRDHVQTNLGSLPLELLTSVDTIPTEDMVEIAKELSEWVTKNDSYLLDLIYGHYRYAEKNDWLSFWEVPPGLQRSEIGGQLEAVSLIVDEDGVATVHVDPRWDTEHKLSLTYRDGTIIEVNDEEFHLESGILFPGPTASKR